MGHPLVDQKTLEFAVTLLQSGSSYQEAADLLRIGTATVNRAWRDFGEHGKVSQHRQKGGRASTLDAAEMEELRKLVLSRSDATYDEITAAWNKKKKQSWSRSAIVRKVLRLGFTRKKKSVEAAEKRKK